MPSQSVAAEVVLEDHVGFVPTFREAVGLEDYVMVIVPRISVPPDVEYILRNSRSQLYFTLMQKASIEVQKIRFVSEGMYVLAEDINQPKRAIMAVLDLVWEGARWDSSSAADDIRSIVDDARMEVFMVPDVAAGDILDAEHHNRLVRAIWRVVDAVRKWFPLAIGPEAKSVLRLRKPEEIVAPDDHNNKRRLLENSYNVLNRFGGFIVVLMERGEGG